MIAAVYARKSTNSGRLTWVVSIDRRIGARTGR